MKRKVTKRVLAFFLAVIIALGGMVATDPSTMPLFAEAGEEGTQTVPGNEMSGEEAETKFVFTVEMPEAQKIAGVDWGTVAVQLTKHNSQTTEFEICCSAELQKDETGQWKAVMTIGQEEGYFYTYQVISENYTLNLPGEIDSTLKFEQEEENIAISGLTAIPDWGTVSSEPGSIALHIKDEKQLELPELSLKEDWEAKLDSVEFASENSNIASIEKKETGYFVTGQSEGSTYIYARIGGSNLYTWKIEVSKRPVSIILEADPGESKWGDQITLTAQILDKITESPVSGLNIEFLKNDFLIGQAITSDEGTAVFEWSCNAAGKYMLRASFRGNDTYQEAVSEEQSYNVATLEQPLELSDYEIELACGVNQIVNIKPDPEGSDFSEQFLVKVDDEDKLEAQIIDSADSDGKCIQLIPKKVTENKIKVTITRVGNDKYSDNIQEIYVSIKPYVLKLNKEKIELSAPQQEYDENGFNNEKIYDGTDLADIRIAVDINEEDLNALNDDVRNELKLCLEEGDTDNIYYLVQKNVSTGIISVKDSGDLEKSYTVTFESPTSNFWLSCDEQTGTAVNLTGPSYTVKRAPLIIKLSDDFEIQYHANTLMEPQYPVEDVKGVAAPDQNQSVIDVIMNQAEQIPRILNPNVSIDETNAVGTQFESGIKADITDDNCNVADNYYFSGSDGGRLTVVPEQVNAFEYLSIDNVQSKHVYQNEDGTVFFLKKDMSENSSGSTMEDPMVCFSLGTPYNKIYKVENQEINPNGEECTEGHSIDIESESGSYYYYLANDYGGRTNLFSITYIGDQEAPSAEIVINEADRALSAFGRAITFGLFSHTYLQADLEIHDAAGQEYGASGIASVRYSVVSLEQDVVFSPENTEITQEWYDEIIREKFTDITDCISEDGSIEKSIYLGKKNAGDPESDEEYGNYIVFVEVVDHVGNAKIYGSNGVVIENISITDLNIAYSDDSDTEDNRQNVNGVDYFKGDVVLEFSAAEDTRSLYSGVKSIQYRILKDQDPEETGTIEAEHIPENVTLEELKSTYSSLSGSRSIDLPEKSSKEIKVEATAFDFAGNESQKTEKIFVIDPVVPEIEMDISSAAEMQNGKYFNQDVRLTVTVTERYLDPYSGICFSINGDEIFLKDLEKEECKELYGISDIIVDQEDESLKDERKTTVTIVFSAEKEYAVAAFAADFAGNESLLTDEQNFVIDKTEPVAQIVYRQYPDGTIIQPGQSGVSPAYLGENHTSFEAVITVTELNFADDSVDAEFAVTASNSAGEEILKADSEALAAMIRVKNNWGAGVTGNDHTQMISFTQDANYQIDFSYTDLAGNELEFAMPTAYITLDRVKPEGSVTVSGLVNGENGTTVKTWWNSFIRAISFGLFGKNDAEFSMTSTDETAGIGKTQYLTASRYLSVNDLDTRSDWTDYNGRVSLPANQNVIVYERVEDRAGNVAYYSSDSIIMDNVDPAPEVTITPTSPAWGKGVYSASDYPGFDILVTDPSVNSAYSGIREIAYTIVNGTTGAIENGTLLSTGRGSHTQTWSGHVSIDPNRFYSNDVRITVTASDWSTNQAVSETKTLMIDNQAPVVSMIFDTSDVRNGKYYKNNKTVTITVNERNFDPSYMPVVSSSTGAGWSFSGWSGNGEVHTGVITFSGDGDYTVTYECYDLAGNRSNSVRQEEFTVDKTLPAIQVSYDNDNVSGGRYYNEERTAVITVTEHNFNPSEVQIFMTGSLDGRAISVPSVSGWSTSGDRHTATVRFSDDGDYTFDVACTDLAGNASLDYSQDSFTIDKTNPALNISGVANQSANKGIVAPVITISDINFDAESVSITLTGAEKGRVSVDGMISRTVQENGQVITFRNFGSDMDDIYTLTAKTVDKAGNETMQSITFSVNRNGSTYLVSDDLKELMEKGFTNTPKDIVIQEINVDTLEFIELTYSKDGKVIMLKEGEDYTVEEEGGNGQWKKYIYTIKASCFEEEGAYVINIYSEDRAENSMTNKSKGMDIEFVVDKTAPSVSIANLENRGRYREDVHQFTLSVKDNTALAYVELYLDGELVHTYQGDELTVEDGVLTIDIESKGTYQTIKLIAYDAAGNPTEPLEYEVLVTSSWWIQFYMNKPLFFGSISAVALLVVLLLVLVVKRRKKDNENSGGARSAVG